MPTTNGKQNGKTHGPEKKNGKPTIDQCAAFVQQIEKLIRDEKRALTLLREAEAEHAQARKRHAERTALAIQQGIDLPDPAPLPEYRRVQQMRDALIQIRALISSHDPDLLSWFAQLQALQQERAAKIAAEFREKIFAPALRQFQLVLNQAYALKLSLNTPDLDSCFDVPAIGDWKNDKAARALYDQYHDPAGALQRLGQFRAAAEQRTLSRERNARLQAMEPGVNVDGNFKVTRAFTQGGRHFKVGEVVDRFSIPEHIVRSALVGQSLGMAKLRPLTPEEELNFFNSQQQQQSKEQPNKEQKETR